MRRQEPDGNRRLWSGGRSYNFRVSYTFFGEESGTHPHGYRCFGIGGFLVPDRALERIDQELIEVANRLGVDRELKWKRIGTNQRLDRFAAAGLDYLDDAGTRIEVMVVDKPSFQLWQSADRSEAFYKCYTLLAKDVAGRVDGDIRLVIDRRSDRYPKHSEVLTNIASHFLKRELRIGRVLETEPRDSKSTLLLQFADLLVGAVTADTNASLLPRRPPFSDAKRTMITHAAGMAGWDRLCHDTMPNGTFNIWHFPQSFRAVPATRAVKPRLPAQ